MIRSTMKKLTLILTALLALVLLTGCVSGAAIGHYNDGVKAYEAHDFIAAKEHFEKAAGYGNSRSYLSAIAEYERIYGEALGFFKERDYAAAANSFSAIKEFGTSAEYLAFMQRLEQRYNEGRAAYDAGDYVLANERFTQALGWADSEDYIAELGDYEEAYRAALNSYYEGNYVRALEAFKSIGVPYRDSEERIANIYRYMTRSGSTPEIFRILFNESCEAEGEDYSLPTAEVTDNGFAWRTTNGLIIMGNTDAYGSITEMSFWVDEALWSELGEEDVSRLYAHCICALAVEGAGLDEVIADIDLYYEGSRGYGAYSLLLDEDDSGSLVLSAVRR